MRFYIADSHFYHDNLNTRMDFRGFENGEVMNEVMIDKWNSRVRNNDEIIILGDLCFSRDLTVVNSLVEKLKGKKYLVVGNHDRYAEKKGFNREAFEWIGHYRELYDNNRKVILSHYPIMCYNGQYRTNAVGEAKTYMLYGHVHNTFDEYVVNEYMKQVGQYKRHILGSDDAVSIPCQMINCFCMFSDYVPLTLDEWIELDKERRAKIKITDYDNSDEIEDEEE